MSAPQPARSIPDAEGVAAFLREHPGFLAERPELYRALLPPRRVHGDVLADHMAAMLRAERGHATAMAVRADDVLAAGRAAAGLAARVQSAVLALIRAADPVDCVAAELPGILAVDAASICIESNAGTPTPAGARRLAPGAIAALLGGRDAVFREAPPAVAPLHGEAAGLARYDALVRVPGNGAAALLALASRDHAPLDPAQGTGALAFLGRAVAASLGR
jgi:uncharacterized protein YigA (DUF484 family)